jgi:predicted regulator of amino acid metabolism with ACT domain
MIIAIIIIIIIIIKNKKLKSLMPYLEPRLLVVQAALDAQFKIINININSGKTKVWCPA